MYFWALNACALKAKKVAVPGHSSHYMISFTNGHALLSATKKTETMINDENN
jgi:hypothetical protein